MKKGQISFEYMMLMGFISFIIAIVIGTAIFYASNAQDKIRANQINQFANKIITTSESIFYAGEPSKATIEVYLPEKVSAIQIAENSIIISLQTSSGLNKVGFSSEVNISGSITSSPGLKRLEILAQQNGAVISQI